MKKKLRLSRETLRGLSSDPLDQVNGGESLGPACTSACNLSRRSSCCDSGDTLASCNVFSCASCLLDTCGCDTNWPC